MLEQPHLENISQNWIIYAGKGKKIFATTLLVFHQMLQCVSFFLQSKSISAVRILTPQKWLAGVYRFKPLYWRVQGHLEIDALANQLGFACGFDADGKKSPKTSSPKWW